MRSSVRSCPRAVRNAPLAVLLAASLALTGCVDGTVRFTLLPDGAGSIAIDLGYETEKWPPMFGDPLAGFLTRDQLRTFTEPGFVAWSQPEVVETPTTRRWRAEVFFDDVGRVQFLGRRQGKVIEALGFEPALDEGRLDLRPGFLVYLEDPLPLPSPEQVGMSDVSLSRDLLDAIRQRIRPVIEGLDVTLEVVLPGAITGAAGLDGFEGRKATLHVDAHRLALAFASKARVLTDDQALRDDPTWSWERPVTWDAQQAEDLRRRRGQALRWWTAN